MGEQRHVPRQPDYYDDRNGEEERNDGAREQGSRKHEQPPEVSLIGGDALQHIVDRLEYSLGSETEACLG